MRSSPSPNGARFDITIFESGPSVGGTLAFFGSQGGTGDRVFPCNDSALDPISAEDVMGPALLWNNPLFTEATEKILGDQIEFFELPSQKVG